MSWQNIRKTSLLRQKTSIESILTKLYVTFESLIQKEVGEYRYDSGEGSQRVKRKSLKEIQEQIDIWERKLDYVCRQLGSAGIVNVQLRRKRDNFRSNRYY